MKNSKLLFKSIFVILILSVFLTSCTTGSKSINEKSNTVSFDVKDVTDIQNPRNVSQKWNTDTLKKTIPFTELEALLKRQKVNP